MGNLEIRDAPAAPMHEVYSDEQEADNCPTGWLTLLHLLTERSGNSVVA
jgi:hypothetical protein